jgi:hypothetical protein
MTNPKLPYGHADFTTLEHILSMEASTKATWHRWSNVAIACWWCNTRKKAKLGPPDIENRPPAGIYEPPPPELPLTLMIVLLPPLPIRLCQEDGRVIPVEAFKQRKFCSELCSSRSRQRQYYIRHDKSITNGRLKACRLCADPFQTTYDEATFCSPDCRELHNIELEETAKRSRARRQLDKDIAQRSSLAEVGVCRVCGGRARAFSSSGRSRRTCASNTCRLAYAAWQERTKCHEKVAA